jgi:hypothetical protein
MARFNRQIAIAVDRMDNVLKEDGLAQKSRRWLRLLNQRCDRSLIRRQDRFQPFYSTHGDE